MNFFKYSLLLFVFLLYTPHVSGMRIDVPMIENGTGIYTVNVSLGSGINNVTDIFCNGQCNSDLSGTNFTGDNTTLFYHWNQTQNGSIAFVNGKAQMFINVTKNVTKLNFNVNLSTVITSNGSNTFQTFWDFADNALPTEVIGGADNPTFSNGIIQFQSAGWEWIKTGLNYNAGVFLLSREKMYGTGGVTISGFGDGTFANIHDDTNHMVSITGASNCPGSVYGTNCQDIAKAGSISRSGNNRISVGEWNIVRNTWNTTYTNLFFNTTNNSYISTNSPIIPLSLEFSIYSGGSNYYEIDYAAVGKIPSGQFGSWGGTNNPTTLSINTWNNTATNNQSLNVSALKSTSVTFSFTVNGIADWYNWTVDGVDQGINTNVFTKSIFSNITINGTAHNISTNNTVNVLWNVNATTYQLELMLPTNNSLVTNPINLQWREWLSYPPYTYQIATDYQFINVVATGNGNIVNENGTATISLNDNTIYYWRVKNSISAYSSVYWFTFTTTPPTTINGSFNITVLDELTQIVVTNFTAQLYNSTTMISNTTTTGWANFTMYDVIAGEYFINILPNSTYSRRSILSTSPNNVTVYVPNAITSTVDTVSFYIMDYTNKFPWTTSHMVIGKNNSVMHSSYFDADAKITANLIRGNSYTISLYNGNNIKQWGNYISNGNANVQIVVMDSGFNESVMSPFTQKIHINPGNITLKWTDSANSLISLNYSIYKGSMSNRVHNIVTSISNGQSEYIVTNTSDIYYIFAVADTINGRQEITKIIDYRSETRTANAGRGYIWVYGSYSVPEWVYSVFSLIALMLLAGSFGALHRGEGSIITAIAALFFTWKGWLTLYTGGIGMIIGLLLFAILYHIDSKSKGGY